MIAAPTETPTQEFSQFVEELFTEIQPQSVVEVGPDNGLRLMSRLGHLCREYTGVTLPDDFERASLYYEMLRAGNPNVRLIAGNATNLSSMIPHADVVFAHNVLFDLTGQDTDLMWEYRRGQKQYSEAELDALRERFFKAGNMVCGEMLKVAKPGHVLMFHRAPNSEPFIKTLIETCGVDVAQISRVALLYDNGAARDEPWELVKVDNTVTT